MSNQTLASLPLRNQFAGHPSRREVLRRAALSLLGLSVLPGNHTVDGHPPGTTKESRVHGTTLKRKRFPVWDGTIEACWEGPGEIEFLYPRGYFEKRPRFESELVIAL